MLVGLRGTTSLPLRSGSQVLYSRAVCATRFRFCCLASTLKSHYSTRNPTVKETNRRSKQLDLDLSALRESKKSAQQHGNSSQPRFQRDQNSNGETRYSAGKRHDDKTQNSARERYEAMLECQHAHRQVSQFRKEVSAFCARYSRENDFTKPRKLQISRELTILIATLLRLDLSYRKKLSAFAVAIIFAPVRAKDVTTVDRLRAGLKLTLSAVLCMCYQAMFGGFFVFFKLHVKCLEWMEEAKR